ncbi:hypothetical protein HYC85_023138 [Camellia sinensis]|uniref:Uncharacterized protein n=1 Tax=Camellia sinensis TaxID=4442 RepID=A0A7J7GDP5_CAMSI|nr:hypothetical protein HYC85_023138 [Camellia sinensis]
MMKGSDHLSKLTQTIGKIIEEGVNRAKSMPSPCIFRVPEELRKVKESAYTPQLVSIGPLHSNKEHLKSPMEDIKKHYAAILFSRVDKKMLFPLVLQKCVEKMKELLHTARGCYAEKVEVDASEDVEKMKESLDKAKECKWFAEKVDAKDVEKMKESLDRAKECFAEKVDDRYVTMLIIDGCFILELLYRYHHTYKPGNSDDETPSHCYDGCIQFFLRKNPTEMIKTSSNPNFKPHEEPHHTDKIGTSNNPNSNNKTSRDFCFDSALTRVAIKHDLLLLENQLPLIVLKDLFDLTVATIPNHLPSLSDYLLSYFGNMMNPSEQGGKNDCEPKIEGVSHILHFLYNQYREGRPEQQDSPKTDFNNYDSMPPASELEYAGVKFEVSTKTGDRDPPFMVQFDSPRGLFWCCHRASFKIPTLRISAATETLLRNLIAFEQYYTGLDNNTGPDRLDFYFTSYAILMDRLINTDKDVKVLEKAGVVCSCLGDREEASDMFNSLCKEIVQPRDNFYFAQTCNQAASYSKRCWPKSLAYLRRTYFAYPWTFIAFLVAFIAFGMSVTQFIRSFLR